MALVNHRAREIQFKLVYYGPGLGGKTTNLRVLYDRLPVERRGRMISIATDHERTLFFDFLPIDLGTVSGLVTRFHLYTVPGQVYYRLSRRAVLQGVDGLVFVADSHPARERANLESLEDLEQHLVTLGHTPAQIARIPHVFQWNKRDVPGALPVDRLRGALNPHRWPEFEAVASEGRGVSDTLRAACKGVLARLSGQAARPGAPEAPPSPGAPTTPDAPAARAGASGATPPGAPARATAATSVPAAGPTRTAAVPSRAGVRPAWPAPPGRPGP
jgi:signal recognition particle receptor subunit beta